MRLAFFLSLALATSAHAFDVNKLTRPRAANLPARAEAAKPGARPAALSAAQIKQIADYSTQQLGRKRAVILPSAFQLSVRAPIAGSATLDFLSPNAVWPVFDSALLDRCCGLAELFLPVRKGYLYLIDCTVLPQPGLEQIDFLYHQHGTPTLVDHTRPQAGHAVSTFVATSDGTLRAWVASGTGGKPGDPAFYFYGCKITPVSE